MSKTTDTIRDAANEAEEAIRTAKDNAREHGEKAKDGATRARDEAKLKAHLLELDARDHFDGLQDRWDKLETRFRKWHGGAREEVHDHADKASDELAATYEELKVGFLRIRDAIVD